MRTWDAYGSTGAGLCGGHAVLSCDGTLRAQGVLVGKDALTGKSFAKAATRRFGVTMHLAGGEPLDKMSLLGDTSCHGGAS